MVEMSGTCFLDQKHDLEQNIYGARAVSAGMQSVQKASPAADGLYDSKIFKQEVSAPPR